MSVRGAPAGVRRVVRGAIFVATGVGLAAAWHLGAQAGARSTRDGVFTPQQAAEGRPLFESICTNCHELDEFTGVGAYLEGVDGEPLWETFDYVSSEMPEDDPGSLAPEEYAAVLAYLFSAYGLPSGDAELPVDAAVLETIDIERPTVPGS